MKKIIILFSLLLLLSPSFSQVSSPSMDDVFTDPMIEEGKRNIILQNKCGNRLTLLMHEESMEMEFVYKPNALRRKDYRARNFSNRDNYTRLFSSFSLPQIKVNDIKEFNYDPFYTILKSETTHAAKNVLHFLNVADENCFVFSAKAPAVIQVKPHVKFEEHDGLLIEKFHDRGEDIVSFIAFTGFEQNRFRRMEDGSYIIQIFGNDVVIVGGEENIYQVNRILEKYKPYNLRELVASNEEILSPKMDKGLSWIKDNRFQRVVDINHRIVYSGMDEGGACFGALNRIYYLIWVRDGSMTTSLMARTGNPELLKTWTPFLLNNPSYIDKEDGSRIPEYLQIVGSRWTKNENDGIYYATLSLFTYFQTTGNDDLIKGKEFPLLLESIDHFLKKTWDNDKKMIVSDTWGETALKDNPYFGYDAVNGNFEVNDFHTKDGKEIGSSASFYNNINTWNILRMTRLMLSQRPDLKSLYYDKFQSIENELMNSLLTRFVNKSKNVFYQGYLTYTDGSELWYDVDNNPWEFSWAQSLGPYFPDVNLSVTTARYIKESWGKENGYGYCPWNCLSNKLYEFGMSADDYLKMLNDEVNDALLLTNKYPMPGGLTEYKGQVESWRALPFSAGSFFYSLSGQYLQSLPAGIAVRGSNQVDSAKNYQYKLSSIDYYANGSGDKVGSYKLNGEEILYTLQIPVSELLAGKNEIHLTRSNSANEFRLYSSTASLQKTEVKDGQITYYFTNPIDSEFLFENFDKLKSFGITDGADNKYQFTKTEISKTKLTEIKISGTGSFVVHCDLAK